MSSYDGDGARTDTGVEDPPLSPTATMILLVVVLLVIVGLAGVVVL